MRSYTDADVRIFRKILAEDGIKLNDIQVIKCVKLYEDFLRKKIIAGEEVRISGIGKAYTIIQEMRIPQTRFEGSGKQRRPVIDSYKKEPRTLIKFVFTKGLKDEINKNFKKVIK